MKSPLVSDNIRLRAVEPSDADFMYEVDNDSAAWRYSDTIAPLSRNQLRAYALSYDANPFTAGQLRLIIVRNNDSMPIGIADLYGISIQNKRGFIGIYIIPDFRKKGYAEEAINTLCRYARHTLLLHTIWAYVDDGNEGSIRLFERCGFSLSARLPEWQHYDGDFNDMLVFSLNLTTLQK